MSAAQFMRREPYTVEARELAGQVVAAALALAVMALAVEVASSDFGTWGRVGSAVLGVPLYVVLVRVFGRAAESVR